MPKPSAAPDCSGDRPRDRLDELLAATDSSVFLLDVHAGPRFCIHKVNSAQERVLGLAEGSLAGRWVDELLFLPPSVLDRYRRCVESAEPFDYEESAVLNGAERWFRTELTPFRGADGRVERLVGLSRDITFERAAGELVRRHADELERQVADRTAALSRANAELTAANVRLQAALDRLNATQAKLMESEKLALLGQLVAGIGHELNTPLAAIASVGQSQEAALRDGLPATLERIARLSPAGRARLAGLAAAALDGALEGEAAGLPPGRAAYRPLRDRLAERLGAEAAAGRVDALRDLGVAPEAVDADWFEYLCGPEAPDLLAAAEDPVALGRAAAVIHTAAAQAGRVVRALSDYAHRGDPELSEVLEPERELRALLPLLQAKLKRGVAVAWKSSGPCRVRGKREQLNQVWLNLINNSLQAMDYRGTLTLGLEALGPEVAVSIGDTGAGIPADLRPRVFEPFFTTKPLGEGTGLGLDICRRIVERHGGSISFESEPGRTVFTVRLPAAPTVVAASGAADAGSAS